jgi:hypothetical protein
MSMMQSITHGCTPLAAAGRLDSEPLPFLCPEVCSTRIVAALNWATRTILWPAHLSRCLTLSASFP